MQRQKSTAILCCTALSFLFVLLLSTGCSKTGPRGANGQDGTIILSGEGAPTQSLGHNGNYYLDVASATLYGPKTSSGWGPGLTLRGAPGAPGSQIYSGSGTPPSSLGIVGDYYIDSTSLLLYGPKKSTGWPMPINLQGPPGNANVMVDTFTLANADWAWSAFYGFSASGASGGIFTRYHDRAFSKVTQDVLDKGTVLVYFTPNNSNPNQWSPLPYSFTFNYQYTYNFVYETMPGVVRLHFFFDWIGQPGTPLPEPDTYVFQKYKFKIVAVSGTIGTAIQRDHVNVNNYADLSKYLGLSN